MKVQQTQQAADPFHSGTTGGSAEIQPIKLVRMQLLPTHSAQHPIT
jgi:hypothetical protein